MKHQIFATFRHDSFSRYFSFENYLWNVNILYHTLLFIHFMHTDQFENYVYYMYVCLPYI